MRTLTSISSILLFLLVLLFPHTAFAQLSVGDKYDSGIVVFVDSTGEHGLICAESDLQGQLTWYQAKEKSESLGEGWRLPSLKELKLMYENLYLRGKGDFAYGSYWSSKRETFGDETHVLDYGHYMKFFESGKPAAINTDWEMHVRAVKTF